ncbi:tetratricopeptide repeat protein [Actinomadura macrotermitis]|nr:tetratricopeptide repeat protein [Actinomadura macrotermitis]
MVDTLVAVLAQSRAGGALASLERMIVRRRLDRNAAPLVEEAHELDGLAKRVMNASVAAERSRGVSWQTIGDTLGITRSSAHGRFADATEEDGPAREEALRAEWRKILELAERHLAPLTHDAAQLEPTVRGETARRLRDLVLNGAMDVEVRLAAAETLVMLDGAGTRVRVESRLREIASRAGAERDEPAAADNYLGSAHGDFGVSVSGGMFQVGSVHGDVHIVQQPSAVPDPPDREYVREMIAAYRAALRSAGSLEEGTRLRMTLAWTLLAYYDGVDHGVLDEAITLFRQARNMSDRLATRDEAAEGLMPCLYEKYELSGDSALLLECIDMAQRLYHRWMEMYGPEHPRVLAALQTWAVLRGENGRPAHAFHELGRVWNIRRRLLGPDHPDTLETQYLLAHWQEENGDRDSAQQALKEVLDRGERVLGADHPLLKQTRREYLRILTARIAAGEPGLVEELEHLTEDARAALRKEVPPLKFP